jgi:hypothetical protein
MSAIKIKADRSCCNKAEKKDSRSIAKVLRPGLGQQRRRTVTSNVVALVAHVCRLNERDHGHIFIEFVLRILPVATARSDGHVAVAVLRLIGPAMPQ